MHRIQILIESTLNVHLKHLQSLFKFMEKK